MVRLRALVAAIAAQSSYATARVVSVGRSETSAGDLISVRESDSRGIDSPVITARSAPVVLAPVRKLRRGNTKRDRRAALDLKGEDTLYWRGQDGTVAELKIEMPGASENIVNLEEIDDMVQEVTCPEGSNGQLKIQFAEEADFNDAEDIWQWLNQEEDNHFMLVVGAETCGENEERIVFNATGLVYNDERETAILNVQQTTWKEAIHTFDLTLGKVATAKEQPRSLRTRRGLFSKISDVASSVVNSAVDVADSAVDTVVDVAGSAIDTVTDFAESTADTVVDVAGSAIDTVTDFAESTADTVVDVADKVGDAVLDAGDAVVDFVVNPDLNPDFTIPFSSDFSGQSLSSSNNGSVMSASCTECFTTGTFDIQGRFRSRQFQLEEAFIEASTDGISAKAVLSLTLKGDLTDTLFEKSVPIFKASPAGISIPGVLTVGPTVSVTLGAEVSQIKGSVTVSFGGTAKISASTARLDFLSESETGASGWKPKFDAEPFKADAVIEAKATAFLKAGLGLEISALETGFSADLSASLPSLSASLKAITSSSCTACGNHQNGLQGSLTLGTSIGVSLKQKVLGDSELLWSLPLVDAKLPELAGFCQGFGLQGDECLA